MLPTVTACRQGLGLAAAHRALLRACRRPGLGYFAKCDIRRYFASVRDDVLLELLGPHCSDDWARALVQGLVHSWSDTPGRGMPIGNLTSQLFANAYLTRTDLTMTRSVGARSYLRYVDDFVWFGSDATILHRQVAALAEELGRVGLCLHPAKTRVAPVSEGVDFAGVVAFSDHVRLRGRSKRRALALWRRQREDCAQGRLSEERYHSSLLSLVALGARTGARGWLRSRGLSW
ncbi:MAG: RNA-directed DNA polymerase [Polyangiaceae bacterium]|nr:RNA-directed DNA polymerase [Polyangiaceae bacterium]